MCGETRIPRDMCAGNTLPGETYTYHCDTDTRDEHYMNSVVECLTEATYTVY